MTVRHHRSAREKSEVVVTATEDVKIEIKRLFKKTDTTADGKITKKELAWAISKYVITKFKRNSEKFKMCCL